MDTLADAAASFTDAADTAERGELAAAVSAAMASLTDAQDAAVSSSEAENAARLTAVMAELRNLALAAVMEEMAPDAESQFDPDAIADQVAQAEAAAGCS